MIAEAAHPHERVDGLPIHGGADLPRRPAGVQEAADRQPHDGLQELETGQSLEGQDWELDPAAALHDIRGHKDAVAVAELARLAVDQRAPTLAAVARHHGAEVHHRHPAGLVFRLQLAIGFPPEGHHHLQVDRGELLEDLGPRLPGADDLRHPTVLPIRLQALLDERLQIHCEVLEHGLLKAPYLLLLAHNGLPRPRHACDLASLGGILDDAQCIRQVPSLHLLATHAGSVATASADDVDAGELLSGLQAFLVGTRRQHLSPGQRPLRQVGRDGDAAVDDENDLQGLQ
mmetsp:Transcript_159116/g.510311  ORF Transcript_159116/g.510311 Transcript_159116/m.510311 type:complete len:288 (-) Transcript_159116:3077-3940(-)